MSNKNYFSSRITINERLAEVGLPSNSSSIQRVGELSARLIDISGYPSQLVTPQTFTPGPSKGTLSMTVEASGELSGTITMQDPANVDFPAGISLPPPGTLGYFAVDKVPEGWLVLGDPFTQIPYKVLLYYQNGNITQPVYANTEYTEIYNILKSWDLVESDRPTNYGRVFNTKDPFKGFFVRSLNPDATGLDSGKLPLETQESSISTHSHDGVNFPTYVDPHTLYEAVGTYNSSSPSYYTFNINRSEQESGGSSPSIIPGTLNTSTRNLNTLNMNYRDQLTLYVTFTSAQPAAEAFSLGLINYNGHLELVNEREVSYSITTNPGTAGAVTTTYSLYGTFRNDFNIRRTSATPWKAQVVFKPKSLLTADIYVLNEQDLNNGGWNSYRSIRPHQTFRLYSFENSQIIDKGRLPFHEEFIEDPTATREPVLNPPGPLLPTGFKIGTEYFYNYKWLFGASWNIIDDGTTQVSYDNYFKEPFNFTDGNGVTHSVTAWDNHIHTRVETYYRSIFNTIYGRVTAPNNPAISPNIPSQYWYSGSKGGYTGPNRHLLPMVTGTPPSGSAAYGRGGVSALPNPTTLPNASWTLDGYVSQGKFSDDVSPLLVAKGYPSTNVNAPGTDAPTNSGVDAATYDTAGYPTSIVGYRANEKYTDELDVTYETPYWLRSYYTFLTVWDRNSEEYQSQGPSPSSGQKIQTINLPAQYASYTVRSMKTSETYSEGYVTYNRFSQPTGYHSWRTTRTRYTQPVTAFGDGATGADNITSYYGEPSSYNQDYMRRTWRTRSIGPRRTFALRRYLNSAEVALHIYKSEPGTPIGSEFYNTGDDGNLAFRTSFEGNHAHALAHDDSHYRGEDQFRPINIALRLCIKY